MGFLLILLVVAMLAYVNTVTVRSLRGRRAGPSWWAVLVAAWSSGAALGVWGGFFFEYRPLRDLRVVGAPVPAAFFHREGPPGEEQWVDFITPAPMLFAASNVVIIALLAACPIGLASWFRRRGLATPEAQKAFPG